MAGERDWALRCSKVDKDFPIQREFRVWRALLGRLPADVVHALRNVTFDVPAGKIVGVIGKNGAGKSTLLRVLGGVYPPTRGDVQAAGSIAGLFELGGLGTPYLTGRAYATRYLQILRSDGLDIPAAVGEILEFSELGEAFDRRIHTYSSGMAARLYFATATAPRHDIYLVDELLSVGDEHFQAKCFERMRQRLLSGASGVLVTHDWQSVLRLCARSHVIDNGALVFSGPSDQAVVSYLGVERPAADRARLLAGDGQRHVARSGEDTRIPLMVELIEDLPVMLSISIESLQIGSGWEVVLLMPPAFVADRKGRYRTSVLIPKLPLATGEYSLNAFLTARPRSPLQPTVVYDTRSWTLGNGLSLEVVGTESPAAVRLPYAVRPLGGVQ